MRDKCYKRSPRYKQRSFENYQRILNNTANHQTTILGIFITLQTMGLGGLIKLSDLKKSILSFAMFCISGCLTLIWAREHNLFEQCIIKSKRFCAFPPKSCWDRTTGKIRSSIFIISCLIWFLSSILYF